MCIELVRNRIRIDISLSVLTADYWQLNFFLPTYEYLFNPIPCEKRNQFFFVLFSVCFVRRQKYSLNHFNERYFQSITNSTQKYTVTRTEMSNKKKRRREKKNVFVFVTLWNSNLNETLFAVGSSCKCVFFFAVKQGAHDWTSQCTSFSRLLYLIWM